jgi:predicted ArsR family transcriptional regulator
LAEYVDPTTTTTGASSATDEILSVLAAEEPHGATADQIARVIGLGLTGEVVQDELEELVMRGVLDRRGIGVGAVYTLAARM